MNEVFNRWGKSGDLGTGIASKGLRGEIEHSFFLPSRRNPRTGVRFPISRLCEVP
jgi:hypothetical protein